MSSNDRIETLRRADPAAGIADGPLDARARADLARTVRADSTTTPARKWVTRRSLLVGAAAGTAAAVGLVAVDPFGATPVAVAAMPPVLDGELQAGHQAKQELRALAAVAGSDTTIPGGGGGPHTVRTESWSLSTRVDGQQVRSAVIPEVTELTWNADGSGRITVRTGQPYFPDSRYEAAWRDDGSPGKPGTVTRDETWQPGEFTPMFAELPLPADPDRLLAALKVGHPIEQYGTGELIVAITDLHNETQPAPLVRAGLLRLLADRPDVVSLGRMTDRAGRPVQGFAVYTALGGLPKRQIMMFDPTTGTLLVSEDILTEEPGKLAVPIPSVISYRLYYPVR